MHPKLVQTKAFIQQDEQHAMVRNPQDLGGWFEKLHSVVLEK